MAIRTIQCLTGVLARSAPALCFVAFLLLILVLLASLALLAWAAGLS